MEFDRELAIKLPELVPDDNLHVIHQDILEFDFGSFEAGSFFLYQSRPQSGGSVYTKLAEFPLSH